MIALDLRTLLIVTALVSIGSTAALVALWRSLLQRNGEGFWAAGMSLVAAASLLISGRGHIHDFLSIVVANSLYVVGFVLILRGIRVFTGRPPLLFLDFTLPLAALLFYYFNYVEQNMNIRIVILSIALAVTCFAIVLTLLRKKNASWRNGEFAVAAVFALFGIAHGVRGAVALLSPFDQPFLQSNICSSLVFLGGIFLIGGSAVTLFLMAQASLTEKLRIFSLAIEQSASSIIITDTTGAISFVNPTFSEKTGYSSEEVIGKNPRVLRSGETPPDEYATLWKTLSAGEIWRGEFHNRKKNGELFWEIASIAPVKQRNGKTSHFVAIKEDITALKDAEEKIRHLANHDSLTGLPTRRLAMDRLISALAIAKRGKKKAAVLFIDLDGFKRVNDTFGHDVGDHLLKETAIRLYSCVRRVDTVARIGGDEFWILLTNIADKDSVKTVAEKIIKAVAAPYQLNSVEVNIGASIGIALYPDHGIDPLELVKRADQAMYQIKRQGKNNCAFADATQTANLS